MKKFRRLFALLLMLVVIVSLLSTTVYADGTLISESIQTGTGLNELNVRSAVLRYFADRISFLKDPSITSFSSAIEGIVVDENAHRELLIEKKYYFDIFFCHNYRDQMW